MSEEPKTAHESTQENLRYALLGSLGGLFTGISISAIANAVSGITPTLTNSLATPFTFILVFVGGAIGFLSD